LLKPWIILDRDGTLIEEKHYLALPEQVELLDGVVEGLRLLADAGARFIVLTNQSGIARGFFSEEEMFRVNCRLLDILKSEGIKIEACFFCPHDADAFCYCRKPNIGLVTQAKEKLGFLNEEICCVIGDKKSDIQLAENLNCRAILVLTGHGSEERKKIQGNIQIASDFSAAAYFIINKNWIGA